MPTEAPVRARARSYALTCSIFCLLAGTHAAWGQPSAGQSTLPVLTQIEQVRRLTPEQARQSYPVHLKAVVTYFDSYTSDPELFLQDATGGLWVAWTPDLPKAEPGQLIELWGTSTQIDFAPDVAKPHWKVVGRAPMPPARPVTLQEMASTSVDARWVEVEGIVRSAEVPQNDTRLRLVVEVPGGRVVVRIPGQAAIQPGLVDSRVRINGACGAIFNQKNQIIAIALYAPSMREIKIIEAGPTDPFAIAGRSIGALQTFNFTGLPTHRVKVAGVVTAQFEGSRLYVSDATGSVYVESSRTEQFAPGDRVEAVGFAGFVDYRPILKDAICRRIAAGPAPAPVVIKADSALDEDKYDSALVSLEAQLTAVSVLPKEEVLILKQGKTTFTAFGRERPADASDDLPDGSRLQVTGICLIERDVVGRAQSFKIRLRSAADVVAIKKPSWWTRDRALSVLGFAALATFSTLAWVFVLRRRVRSQTAELRNKNDELAVALNAAKESTQLKSEFLANMSHEIRTPMNAILGLTAFALESTSREEQQEYLRDVMNSAESLLSLLNDILDLSKIEAGRMELAPIQVPMAQLIQEVTHFLKTAASQKGLELAWNVAPEVPEHVSADPLRLRQVLLNLIGNAIKFTETGSVRVEAKAESQDDKTVCLRFAVRDTGPGIPDDKQDLIFKSFCQADGTTTRRHGGTGLGLTISAHLVELMGGKIWVESKVGSGSTFYFTARFGKADAPATRPQARPAAMHAGLEGEAKSQLGSLKILIAEDNFSSMKLLTRLLERWGQQVTIAVNGREALNLFERDSFDLMLLDIQMPEMDGFEVTAAIREIEKKTGRHTPICALTAHALRGQREECLARGMDGFVTKPIEPKKLLEALVSLSSTPRGTERT
jgi:signal transduction histidine kinase/ActR/RegA family two-component response regulator